MSDEETRFVQACLRLVTKAPTIELEIRTPRLLTMISSIQLALRHPHFQGPVRDDACKLVASLILLIEELEPELGPLLRQGFDPRNDVTVDRPGVPGGMV